MSSVKPLFIPLKTEYYNEFVQESKFYELRLEGPRWNARTCFFGRPVVLSKGYGKAHRMNGVVTETWTETDYKQEDFVALYGKGKTARIIGITINPPEQWKEQEFLKETPNEH